MAAISHSKSNTIGDWAAGQVTVFNSQGSTATANATDLVRPGDWNSAHNAFQTISSQVGGSTAGTANATATNIVFGGADGIYASMSTVASAATIYFGEIPGTIFEPRKWDTSSAWSSHGPASTFFQYFSLAEPMALKWLVVPKSVSIGIPAGTSSNTTQTFQDGYTHYASIFQRKNTGNSSDSLTLVTYGSLVNTFRFAHSSTSMYLYNSWNTDSTGGTSAQNASSNATANLVSVYSGNRMVSIPMPATTLQPGEYWLAQAHSSSQTATSATATTLGRFSNLHIVPMNAINMAPWGASAATNSSVNPFWPNYRGIATAVTTNADMNASVISGSQMSDWYCIFKGW
jgi:hypothetical protein